MRRAQPGKKRGMKRAIELRTAFLLIGYVATVFVANWVTASFGLVPAGFGLMVTAGTYSAGLALGVRDTLQEAGGVRWALVGIGAGVVASAFVSPALALASGTAFLASELLDLAVYTPIRKSGHRIAAVFASNTVGSIVDTFVFLSLAGFAMTSELVGGQLLVKAVWVSITYVAVSETLRRTLRPRPALAEGVAS